MLIREAISDDFDAIWPIFHAIVAAGDTYAYVPDSSKDEAFAVWMSAPQKTFVCEQNGQIVGTYYLKPNQPGLGVHVCNCGYMVAVEARGQGLARAMCEHSQTIARELGYQAMQFNLVVATNEAAVRLWQKLGFAVVGRLPKAFRHVELGLVDALIMYKWLGD
jgi:ribosomal protein S18 acetylase RimI-like enzyme